MTATTTTDNGTALSRLIVLLNPHRTSSAELDNVVRRLESLQLYLAALSEPDPIFVNQNVRGIRQDINRLLNRDAWRPTAAQTAAYNQFLEEMDDLTGITQTNSKDKGGFSQFTKDHPLLTAACGGALVVGGSLALGPALLVGGLNLLGFSAAGPVAGMRSSVFALPHMWLTILEGSIAAGIQSAVYGGAVASGSAFALAQSAAMGGVAVASGAELAAAAVAASAGAAMIKKAKGDQDDKDDESGSGDDDDDDDDDDHRGDQKRKGRKDKTRAQLRKHN
ncbi:hypothetical protein FRC03_001359 [Tulasnella sp. 419]|nr:hypothetical protein FRC03_001359 [Tulasnella sp. 419]